MRSGVVATKIGMSRYFNPQGVDIPVTVLRLESCQVTAIKTVKTDGYNAVQVGTGAIKIKNVTKPLRGHFAKAKVEPKAKLAEFRVSEDALLEVGQEIAVEHYVPGQYVDVAGTSKGKGFAGGMKRWGFAGLEATHGVSISHRSHGSTGQCQDPGKVFKGKKMAGHMGDARITVQNLEIIDVDSEDGLLIVNGSIPGSKGSYVYVTDAVKRARPAQAPYPAGVKASGKSEKKTEAVEASQETKEQGESDES